MVGRCTWLPHSHNESDIGAGGGARRNFALSKGRDSCARNATTTENEGEYSELAMELFQAELIQTPTDDMFGHEAGGSIFTRQDVLIMVPSRIASVARGYEG